MAGFGCFMQVYNSLLALEVGFHIMIKRVVIGKDEGLCYEEGF